MNSILKYFISLTLLWFWSQLIFSSIEFDKKVCDVMIDNYLSLQDRNNLLAYDDKILDKSFNLSSLRNYSKDIESDSQIVASEKEKKRFPERLDLYTESPFFRVASIGLPLVAYSLIIKSSDDYFRDLRNDYTPRFRYTYDDYLQYAPAGLMLGLKAFGVEGRSSWCRMLVSDAFSAALMATTVNVLKYSVKRNRPDDSTKNSFPSGHTATAFMTATMLHKEYGMTKSYWYSAAGYIMATATGISRQLNNKHWVSDIVFGATVGIMATEFGYLLADLIFKNKGLLNKARPYAGYDENANPSFIGLNLGNSFMLKRSSYATRENVKVKSGCHASLEGAYFRNKSFGVGGRLTTATARVFKDDMLIDDSFDIYSFQVGPYYSLPLSKYWLIGANVLAGLANVPDYNEDFVNSGRNGAWLIGAGTSFAFMPNKNLSLKCLIDYSYTIPFVKTPIICNNIRSISGGVGFVF